MVDQVGGQPVKDRPLTIKQRPVAGLVPYAANARQHSKAQVEKIATSIERFGLNNPVLIDDDSELVAGHGRLAAAKRLDLETAPVDLERRWTAAATASGPNRDRAF